MVVPSNSHVPASASVPPEQPFASSGSGAMELPSISYDFTYTIDGNKLMIDYVNESVRDSEYEFTVDGNTLTLIGGEGTVGGTYELKRSSKK